jgi:hypothetical protein
MAINEDDELIMAHLMGGANGINFKEPPPSSEEIKRRVGLTLLYMIEIRHQVAQWRKDTDQLPVRRLPSEYL